MSEFRTTFPEQPPHKIEDFLFNLSLIFADKGARDKSFSKESFARRLLFFSGRTIQSVVADILKTAQTKVT
jgi:hypothetical protein